MATDLVTPAGTSDQHGRTALPEESDVQRSNEQVAPSTATPEEQMMTKKENSAADEAQNAAEVDIQQLLQKYGQVQNQFMLMEDTKKRYNKEGFRIRFRLSRAYRGLEKQEILASRPEVSSLNGPKRKKALQKLMQQLEQNLMLFDPDEDAKRKAQERELERQKLLKECRENARKKWTRDGEPKGVQENANKGTGWSKGPSRYDQHMSEYWGKPVQKKGKEVKGDWRIKQKQNNAEKPWWHKFTKKKKPKITNKGAHDGAKLFDGTRPKESDGKDVDEEGPKLATDKFFITNPESQSDTYSAVEEWQRRNEERKGRKAERMNKLRMASRSNKNNKSKEKLTAGVEKKDDQGKKDTESKSKLDNSNEVTNGLNDERTEMSVEPNKVPTDDPDAKEKTEENDSPDVKKPEEIEEEQLIEKSKYSFMAFGGFSSFSQKSCKSSASSATSASSARSEEEFDADGVDKNRLDMLLRAQNNIAPGSRVGSRDGSKAGSSVSKHGHEPLQASHRQTHRQTKQAPHKATIAHPKSVTFKTDPQEGESPQIEIHDPDGQEIDAAAPLLPGQVTAVKPKDTTVPSRKPAPGILKDSPSNHKLHRTKSAPPSHGHRPRVATSSLRDDSSSQEAKEEDKPLKICRYMYTMCNCQRVGKPSTLAKLQQRRKKTVGVITVFGCPDEEERKRSTSPTVCPFCSVFPRYRINAWLKDVPVVTVD
ncbi:hypothetical protein LSH36_241g07004 [Paralvinella palmiformis]|uniref:Uncharacterized protein n=1 Tax=Paralvinella palmiformis TaxID=53620 RepID=A0AAD9JMY7_9ANNE|nr:hypothetical protein LSH36_241g07004 [Paralvinella palmiformis]